MYVYNRMASPQMICALREAGSQGLGTTGDFGFPGDGNTKIYPHRPREKRFVTDC
jgi:hypothetical protein